MALEDEIKKEIVAGETPTKLAYDYANSLTLLEKLKEQGLKESDSKYKEISGKLDKAKKMFSDSIRKYGIEIQDPETALSTYLNGRGCETGIEQSVKHLFNTAAKQIAVGKAIIEYDLGISSNSPKYKKEKDKVKSSLLDSLNVKKLKDADVIKIITTDLDELIASYHRGLELLKNPQYRELNKEKMKDIKKAWAEAGKELKEYLDKVFEIYGFKGLGEAVLEDLQHQGLEGGTLEWVSKLVDKARSKLYGCLNSQKNSVYKAAYEKRLELYKPRPRTRGKEE